MSKRNFTKEFKQTIVDLVSSGHKVSALSTEYSIAESLIYKWCREFKNETGSFKDAATLALEKENRALKRALKDAKEERDILKKAVRIFSVSGK